MKCKIINRKFSWGLIVDGQNILFQGHKSAQYFKQHYESLGYEVIIRREEGA